MFLAAILDFAEKMMFARLDFPRFLVCGSGDLSDDESEEKPSVAICGGSICILTGLSVIPASGRDCMDRKSCVIRFIFIFCTPLVLFPFWSDQIGCRMSGFNYVV